jgi:hypothetical protein
MDELNYRRVCSVCGAVYEPKHDGWVVGGAYRKKDLKSVKKDVCPGKPCRLEAALRAADDEDSLFDLIAPDILEGAQ